MEDAEAIDVTEDFAPVVRLWGQLPDVPDGDGDVFTAAALAAIPEPDDDELITLNFRSDYPRCVWGTYGQLKERGVPAGMALRPGFVATSIVALKDAHGQRTGLRYAGLNVLTWSLVAVPARPATHTASAP